MRDMSETCSECNEVIPADSAAFVHDDKIICARCEVLRRIPAAAGGAVVRSRRAKIIAVVVLLTIGALTYLYAEKKRSDETFARVWSQFSTRTRSSLLEAVVGYTLDNGQTNEFRQQIESQFREWKAADAIWQSIAREQTFENEMLMCRERDSRERTIEGRKDSHLDRQLRDYTDLLRELNREWRRAP